MISLKQQFHFNNSDRLIAIIIIIFLKPGIVEDIDAIDILFNMGRFGFSILFIFQAIVKNKIKNIIYPIMIFLIITLSTYLNNGQISKAIGHWIPIIGMLSWLYISRYKLLEISRIFTVIGGLFIIVNFLSILLYPNGILNRIYIPIWILGQKQDLLICYFPTLLFGILANKWNLLSNKFKILIIISGILTLLILRPIGLIITTILLFCMTYFDRIFKYFSINNLFKIIIILEIIAIGLAFVYEDMTGIKFYLESITMEGQNNKYQTLGTRFSMWTYGIQTIKNNPLIGVGQITESTWYKTSGLDYYHSILHNLLLDITFTGGILSIIILLIWFSQISKKLNYLSNYEWCRYIGYAFFSFNIICITECPYQPSVFIVIGVAMILDQSLVKSINTYNYK